MYNTITDRMQSMLYRTGLTHQQIELITVISGLQKEKFPANTSSIAKAYNKLFGKYIQRSNLFSQLKRLQEKNILEKEENLYFVSVKNIQMLFNECIKSKKAELDDIQIASDSANRYLKETYNKDEEAKFVYFPTHEEYFNKIVKRIEKADACYLSSIFPGTCFTQNIINHSNAPQYFSFIQKVCNENSAKLYYMSGFNVSYLFNIAMLAKKNRRAAYDECMLAMENLKQQIRTCKNLQIRLLPYSFGLFFVIPEINGTVKDCFIFAKKSGDRLGGGILIESEDMAEDLKNMFLREFKNAADLRKSQKLMEIIRKRFIRMV